MNTITTQAQRSAEEEIASQQKRMELVTALMQQQSMPGYANGSGALGSLGMMAQAFGQRYGKDIKGLLSGGGLV